MKTEFTERLDEIIKARNSVYKLSPLLVAVIAAGLGANYLSSGLGAVFGIAAFLIFYKRLVVVAHMPCPSCGKPFGTKSATPLGVGSKNCQNCGLSLYD